MNLKTKTIRRKNNGDDGRPRSSSSDKNLTVQSSSSSSSSPSKNNHTTTCTPRSTIVTDESLFQQQQQQSSQKQKQSSDTPVVSHCNNTTTNGKQQQKQQQKDTELLPLHHRLLRLLRTLLRVVFLDVPLLLLFTSFLSMVILQYVYHTYLLPQGHLMKWIDIDNTNNNNNGNGDTKQQQQRRRRRQSDMTYYNRICTTDDITTTRPSDLILNNDNNISTTKLLTGHDCMHHMAKHGVSIYPNVMSSTTADELRTYLVERNRVEKGWYVISGQHRFTFGIRVNQSPIVSRALEEIASHNPLFQSAITEICGPNPAVIEFTAITSEYGAGNQFWHQDTLPMGSSFKHGRTFVPSYSLFIPLQDTTADIGATQICPGSHVCNGDYDQFCVDHGFVVSNSTRTSEDDDDEEDDRNAVWPKAAGALVNQHTFHRGMAHTNPHGLDRVLFILTFAPRPRVDKNEVETRLLSWGGSYSIDWRQWGHTLNDFGTAKTTMKEPWKTLRSLGLYKPRNANWGWDWPTVTTMRIINQDNGYRPDQLEEWLEESGGLSFLPKALQAEYDPETGWEGYFRQTIAKCEKTLEKTYVVASGVYLIFFLTLSLVQRLVRGDKKKRSGSSSSSSSPFLRAVLRLVVSHAIVVALACYALAVIANTQWAQNIRNGKAFNIPIPDELPDDMSPGTLPFKTDVLVETKYDSEYLYGTNFIIQDAHPGNVFFGELVDDCSNGYRDLSPTLQAQLTAKVINWIGQDFGRFLTQNEEGNWYEMTFPDAQKVVHKELVKNGNPIVGRVLTELAYLMSETKFGVYRDLAIHRKHIPDMLNRLQDKILDPPSFQPKRNSSIVTPLSSDVGTTTTLRLRLSTKSFLPEAPTLLQDDVVPQTASTHPDFPPEYDVAEPYPAAWTNEGDIVEAKYKGVYNEWYKATVFNVDADSGTYDVEYADGEVDYGLCRLCIRPYKPLEVDEVVSVLEIGSDAWYEGRVITVHGDETFDIETDSNGVFDRVPVERTRRSEPAEKIEVGSRVEALFQGRGKEWFPAIVHKVRNDGTFDLHYDDGDRETRVERKFIRVRSTM